MAKLPSGVDLGPRPEIRPATGAVGYQATTGHEEDPGLALAAGGATLEQFAKVEQEKADTVKVEDAWNQYKNKALDLTAGDNGVLRLKGSDAVNSNMMQGVEAQLKDTRTKFMESLQSDEQRTRFKARADTTDYGVKHQIMNHLVTERAAYDDTTMAGTVAAARAQVTALPTDKAVFMQAEGTILAQADAYLDRKGIRDAGARQEYKDKITDSLWTSRIDALLYSQPVLADAMFRANEKEIKNPELRLLLQNKTREIALGVVSTNDAERFIQETRQEKPAPSASPAAGERATPEGGPSPGGPISVRQNNPGNITDPKTGQIRTFATREDGERALDAELKLKLSGESAAYQRRFGSQPVTPARLAETWAPAAAKGNTAASTTNYGRAIAAALGIGPDDPIPNTAEAQAKVKSAITAFEAGGSGGMQTVAATTTVQHIDTSGLPNSKDIAAQLPLALARVERSADDRYGPDRNNPDRVAYVTKTQAAVRAKISAEVAQLDAVQKQSFDRITDFILGPIQGSGTGAAGAQTVSTGGAGGMQRVTSFSQIQANPEMMRNYQMLTADGKRAVDTQLRVNANDNERGDSALYNELRNRINLPPDDPNKINWWQTLNNDPRVSAGRLSRAQLTDLRGELDRSSTDDGRTQAAVKKSGENLVKQMFDGDWTLTMGGTQKGNAAYALELWARNADRVIGLYKQQNKDIRPLFDPDPKNKESLITPQAIAQFKTQAGGATSGAEALSAAAGKAKTDATPPPAQMPANIKDDAGLQAWFKTLPANVDSFIGTDGKRRLIPNRTPAAAAPQEGAAAPAAAQPGKVTLSDAGLTGPSATGGTATIDSFGNRRDGTPKGNGFLGVLQRPDGKVSTELSIGVNVNGKDMDVPTLVPTLTRPEVDHLLAMKDGPPPPRGTDKVFDQIVEKAAAHAKERIAAGKSVFATPEEAAKATPPAPAAAADDIPTLVEGPMPLKGARTEEQKIAAAARLEDIFKGRLQAGVDAVWWAATTPMRMVARVGGDFVQVVKALSRTDEERAVTGFRQVLKQGTFRANEDTVVMLNNFLASKKGTEAENVKATKMLKVIADKLGIEPTPADSKSGSGGGSGAFSPTDAMDSKSRAKYKEATGEDINGPGATPASAELGGYKTGTDSKVGKGTSAQDERAIKLFMGRGMTRAQAEAEVARTKR